MHSTVLYIASTFSASAFVAAVVAPDPSTGFDYVAPILSTGIVGVFMLMLMFRVKIMPTYVFDAAKTEWERERNSKDADIAELKSTLKEANAVYTTQVIPVLTSVLDSQRELVDLRRMEGRIMQMPAIRGSNVNN